MTDGSSTFTHRLTVRFSDCDAMGHVNHAVYFTYFEQCRFAWWRHLGGAAGIPGATTIIVHADCDYRAPAHVHDELEIRLTLTGIGRTSISIAYQIANLTTGQQLADGHTVNVTVDPVTRVPVPVPEFTRAQLTGRNA